MPKQALVFVAVKHDVFVDFIGQQINATVSHDIGEPVKILCRENSASGVVRKIENDEARLTVNSVCQSLPVDAEIATGHARKRHMRSGAAGESDGGLVGIISRVENDNFVALARKVGFPEW